MRTVGCDNAKRIPNSEEIHQCELYSYPSILFSRSAERSELLIESEARSAESRSDVAPNARRRAQADANLGQGFYIYLFIYLFIWMYARHSTMALT